MNVSQAYEILMLSVKSDFKDIKKRYRQLMHRVHPDSGVSAEEYPYTAQEINEAYETLRSMENEGRLNGKRDGGASHRAASKAPRKKKYARDSGRCDGEPAWDAAENPHAYMKRKIFHGIEDMDGRMAGAVVAAEGKYLWKTEEEFPLFLKSIFECTERLLREVDAKTGKGESSSLRLRIQAELAYLLAQQFIDGAGTLEKLLTPTDSNEEADTFYIPAMLEMNSSVTIRSGMVLYPAGIRAHRLYLRTKSGKDAGYLSFRDDRLYYIVIPLLEQRRAQVKIEVSMKQDRKNTRGNRWYKNLDFWLRVLKKTGTAFPESIGLQIQELLRKYRER